MMFSIYFKGTSLMFHVFDLKENQKKMVNKVLGYVFSLIGLVGLALYVISPLRERVFGFLPESVTGVIGGSLLIISIALLAVGIVLIFVFGREHKQSSKEVPIYKGKEIIGYRRAD